MNLVPNVFTLWRHAITLAKPGKAKLFIMRSIARENLSLVISNNTAVYAFPYYGSTVMTPPKENGEGPVPVVLCIGGIPTYISYKNSPLLSSSLIKWIHIHLSTNGHPTRLFLRWRVFPFVPKPFFHYRKWGKGETIRCSEKERLALLMDKNVRLFVWTRIIIKGENKIHFNLSQLYLYTMVHSVLTFNKL